MFSTNIEPVSCESFYSFNFFFCSVTSGVNSQYLSSIKDKNCMQMLGKSHNTCISQIFELLKKMIRLDYINFRTGQVYEIHYETIPVSVTRVHISIGIANILLISAIASLVHRVCSNRSCSFLADKLDRELPCSLSNSSSGRIKNPLQLVVLT